MSAPEEILAYVQREADALSDETLRRWLDLLDNRQNTGKCRRHEELLRPYVFWKLELRKKVRQFENEEYNWPAQGIHHMVDSEELRRQTVLARLQESYDEANEAYHNQPCTCFVPHR